MYLFSICNMEKYLYRGLYTELFYAMVSSLFLLFHYPYVLLHLYILLL